MRIALAQLDGADETVVCAAVEPRVIARSTEVFDYRRERRPELYAAPGA